MRCSFLFLCLLLAPYALPAQTVPVETELRKHVDFLAADSLLGRRFGSVDAWKANQYIIREFQAAGIPPFFPEGYLQAFSVGNTGGYNVVGVIESDDPAGRQEYIVIGAHYDHLGWETGENGEKVVYNGANDNASGVAVLLEVGKRLKQRQKELKRSIILIAFDGEEQGLYGSVHFFDTHLVRPEAIKCMFSIDMVGMYTANDGLILSGVNMLKNGMDYFTGNFASDPDIKLQLRNRNKNPFYGTDSDSFLGNGVPGIHVHTGLDSPYHQPEDDADRLDYEGMAKVVDVMEKISVKLSDENELEPAVKPEYSASVKFGLNIALGASHYNYNDAFFNSKSRFAFGAGLFSEIKLFKPWLWLRPEVAFESAGGDYWDDYVRDYSVAVPVNVVFRSTFHPAIAVYAGVGGYYKYHFAQHYPADYGGKLDNQDYGLNLLIGFDVMKFRIEAAYRYDFSRSLHDPAFGRANLQTVMVVLGFGF